MYFVLKQFEWNKEVSTPIYGNKGFSSIQEANEKKKALETLEENKEVKYFITQKVA